MLALFFKFPDCSRSLLWGKFSTFLPLSTSLFCLVLFFCKLSILLGQVGSNEESICFALVVNYPKVPDSTFINLYIAVLICTCVSFGVCINVISTKILCQCPFLCLFQCHFHRKFHLEYIFSVWFSATAIFHVQSSVSWILNFT